MFDEVMIRVCIWYLVARALLPQAVRCTGSCGQNTQRPFMQATNVTQQHCLLAWALWYAWTSQGSLQIRTYPSRCVMCEGVPVSQVG
jgi:hypothetical protein